MNLSANSKPKFFMNSPTPRFRFIIKPISTIKLVIQTEVWLLKSKKQDFLQCKNSARMVRLQDIAPNIRDPSLEGRSASRPNPLENLLATGMVSQPLEALSKCWNHLQRINLMCRYWTKFQFRIPSN